MHKLSLDRNLILIVAYQTFRASYRFQNLRISFNYTKKTAEICLSYKILFMQISNNFIVFPIVKSVS